MTRQRAAFRQSDITSALKPALALGLTVVGYEISQDGQVIVHTSAAGEAPADAALEAWRRQSGKDTPSRD